LETISERANANADAVIDCDSNANADCYCYALMRVQQYETEREAEEHSKLYTGSWFLHAAFYWPSRFGNSYRPWFLFIPNCE